MTFDTRVTKIGDRWHARLLDTAGNILDEMACNVRQDIGWMCREMMRWQDKGGNGNDQTQHARASQTANPVGRVWFQVHLNMEKEARRGKK